MYAWNIRHGFTLHDHYSHDLYEEEPIGMWGLPWNLIFYILAVVAGLVLFMVYEPKSKNRCPEDESPKPQRKRRRRIMRFNSLFAVLGLDPNNYFEAFGDRFSSFEEVSLACKRAGLENSNLIIGVDFTASNEWQGRKSFHQNCLHKVDGNKIYNPYQKVIWILGQTLKPFDEDNLIPAYGFGDSETTDDEVFPFRQNESPCSGFEEVLEYYNNITRRVTLSGPTSFAPIIMKAIHIVKRTRKYHILVIIADGQVTEEKRSIDAIVEASNHPISIIVVGVGDGPWDVMEEFDHRLPRRKFDNFRFVDYHRATAKKKNHHMVFALQALMEIPDQYKAIRDLGYIDETPLKKSASEGSHIASKYTSESKHHLSLRERLRNSLRRTPQNSPPHTPPKGSPTLSPVVSPRISPKQSPRGSFKDKEKRGMLNGLPCTSSRRNSLESPTFTLEPNNNNSPKGSVTETDSFVQSYESKENVTYRLYESVKYKGMVLNTLNFTSTDSFTQSTRPRSQTSPFPSPFGTPNQSARSSLTDSSSESRKIRAREALRDRTDTGSSYYKLTSV